MRLPNGYGNISKLPGNRRKPWRVRITSGWETDNETGRAKQQYTTIGYYATRQEAMKALADYHSSPYDPKVRDTTFSDVYNMWSERKYAEISASNIKFYKSVYKLCRKLYEMPINEIKLRHLQEVIDTCGKNHPVRAKIKVLFNQVFDYAAMHEIIPSTNHCVQYVDVGKGTKSSLHYRYTDKEIQALWDNADNNDYVQLILMMIYSGVRPGELFNLRSADVDLSQGYFSIRKGKNDNAIRKVPIHHKTLPYFENWLSKGTEYLLTNLSGKKFNFDTNHNCYTTTYFVPILEDIGILYYINDDGEKRQHLPDDTRHTFTTMWKEKRLDEAMRRKIQGHSGAGVGEIVYTHYDLKILRDELNKL